MRLSQKFPVPLEVATLYDFVNSLDLRTYVERGAEHSGSDDELTTPRQLEDWLRLRGLLPRGTRLTAADLQRALELRAALRAFLELEPSDRRPGHAAAVRLAAASVAFPLVMGVADCGASVLRPATEGGGVGAVLAELHELSVTGRLERLRMCDSDECRWMFFDRSKPGTRRWCSSVRCGNREKTRAYRGRRAAAVGRGPEE